MTVYAATSAAESRELATLILDVMARAADEVTDAEASRARAQSKAGMLMALESPMRRAETLARQVALRDRPFPMSEIEAIIDSVDAAAVRGALRSVLDGPAPSAVYLGPEGGGLADMA